MDVEFLRLLTLAQTSQADCGATKGAASRLPAMMDNKPFGQPVVVELGQAGRYRRISNTQEAAECLMTVWPLNRGPRHRDALDTCLKVLEGYRSTADARQALVEAAREADVLVSDDRPH